MAPANALYFEEDPRLRQAAAAGRVRRAGLPLFAEHPA
jgi:hypothetical protein